MEIINKIKYDSLKRLTDTPDIVVVIDNSEVVFCRALIFPLVIKTYDSELHLPASLEEVYLMFTDREDFIDWIYNKYKGLQIEVI